MPIPTTLAEIIKSLADNFQPSKSRPAYDAEKGNWQLYLDLMEMDQVKLQSLIEKHDDEGDPKLELRKKLAAVFNYTPTLIRMVVNYLHSVEPTIDVGGDADLKAFVSNCDGNGMTLTQYTRQVTLPLSLVFGFVDTLVQNPDFDPNQIKSAQDEKQAGLRPTLYAIRPLQRLDWSTKPNHSYNWVRFIDYDSENDNPFRVLLNEGNPVSYVTIAGRVEAIAELAATNGDKEIGGGGFWIRSWEGVLDDKGEPAKPDATGKFPEGKKQWIHDGGWLSVSMAPIETLYYTRSNDPTRRHMGLSKIAMVAILTKKIIQLLSWTDEDVLANLAIFIFPGKKPTDEKGNPIDIKLTPFTIIWTGGNPQVQAQMLQGTTELIQIKLQIIDVYIREILRLAYLIGASAEAEKITSGVQGVVARNELFMELADIAGALDTYTLGILRFVKAHIANTDVAADTLSENVKVDYFKGPYMVDPLETTIKNSKDLIDVFARISPEMVKQVYKQLALAVLFNEDKTRQTVLTEIDTNFSAVQAEDQARRDALAASLTSGAPADVTTPGNAQPANPFGTGQDTLQA